MHNYEPLLVIAREAIDAVVHDRPPLAPPSRPIPESVTGVFVTLTGPDGRLRGCIGHLELTEDSLAAEVIECAVAAAIHDHRFSPVRKSEVENLNIEISLLGALEPVESISSLDPKIYGVVVESGSRRGVLLPDIEGVDTIEQQLGYACEKAGLFYSPQVHVSRFRVTKVVEKPHTESR